MTTMTILPMKNMLDGEDNLLECTNKKFPEEGTIKTGLLGIEKENGFELYSHAPKVIPILPKGFFITHDAYVGPHIEAFIHQTEDIIDLESKRDKKDLVLPLEPPVYKYLYKHSVFGMTNKRKATWVEPSSFWTDQQYKKSLFVYLLFCGIQYAKLKDYQAALESYQFVSRTIIAIKRFLFGFTKIKNPDDRQWYDLFVGVEEKQVKDMLSLPDCDEPYESCIDALWTP